MRKPSTPLLMVGFSLAGALIGAGLSLARAAVRGRPEGASGGAFPAVRAVAAEQGLGPAFVAAVVRLADNESGGTFGKRGGGTSWGVFQYNATAWHRITGGGQRYPWQASPDEEVRLPIAVDYATIWRAVVATGASSYYAERAIRLWHMAPAIAYDFVDALEGGADPAAAWNAINFVDSRGVHVRKRIEERLYAAESFTGRAPWVGSAG